MLFRWRADIVGSDHEALLQWLASVCDTVTVVVELQGLRPTVNRARIADEFLRRSTFTRVATEWPGMAGVVLVSVTAHEKVAVMELGEAGPLPPPTIRALFSDVPPSEDELRGDEEDGE